MAIETLCQGCGKRLRVGDEHAGKLARCPHCQTLYTVPPSGVVAALGAGSASDSPLAAGDRWHLRTTDGLTFGPVVRAELDRWLAEGRINANSQILHEGEGQWVWASQVYPQLPSVPANAPYKPKPPPHAPLQPVILPTSNPNPYASPTSPGALFAPVQYLEPHRGGAILTLAIVGAFFCNLVSIAALILAFSDLRKMNGGEMDPSGRGLTIAGAAIAVISLVLIALSIAAFAFLD